MISGQGFALAAAIALAACSSQADTGSSSTTTSSTGSGGSGGGGPACPAGSHAAMSGCAATLSGWSATAPLATARDHHAAFAATTPAGSFLYVAGGTSGFSALASIERAKVNDDGSLAPFASAGKVPDGGRIGPGVAQVGRTVVLAGGLANSGNSTTSVYLGAIADDGSVAFSPGPALVKDRYHLTLSAAGGYLYAIGGLYQSGMKQSLVDAVEIATFDGASAGAFQAIEPLPWALTHHAAAMHGKWLYLAGGITGSAPRTDVYRAELLANGHLGAWQKSGDLPEGRGTSAAVVFLDQLYVIAGAAAAHGSERATVLRASFQADGSLGAFEELAPLPKAGAHAHQVPQIGSFLYSTGGELGDVMQADVFAGALQ